MDANYNFIYVDVGCNGRISDEGVFRNSTLAISTNLLNISGPHASDDDETEVLYVIVAADALPLIGKSYENIYFQSTIHGTEDL